MSGKVCKREVLLKNNFVFWGNAKVLTLMRTHVTFYLNMKQTAYNMLGED